MGSSLLLRHCCSYIQSTVGATRSHCQRFEQLRRRETEVDPSRVGLPN